MSRRVAGYRMRFAPPSGTGEIVLYLVDTDGGPKTEFLRDLTADRFTAVAMLLTTDKDHRILWDGTTLDAGPEET